MGGSESTRIKSNREMTHTCKILKGMGSGQHVREREGLWEERKKEGALKVCLSSFPVFSLRSSHTSWKPANGGPIKSLTLAAGNRKVCIRGVRSSLQEDHKRPRLLRHISWCLHGQRHLLSWALVIAFINAAIFGIPTTLWTLVWTEKSPMCAQEHCGHLLVPPRLPLVRQSQFSNRLANTFLFWPGKVSGSPLSLLTLIPM